MIIIMIDVFLESPWHLHTLYYSRCGHGGLLLKAVLCQAERVENFTMHIAPRAGLDN